MQLNQRATQTRGHSRTQAHTSTTLSMVGVTIRDLLFHLKLLKKTGTEFSSQIIRKLTTRAVIPSSMASLGRHSSWSTKRMIELGSVCQSIWRVGLTTKKLGLLLIEHVDTFHKDHLHTQNTIFEGSQRSYKHLYFISLHNN